ncbi:MAG: hypothetical protein J6S04_02570 [Clostridia bacterium]|nr:hypothetical protein [Clostridia bacterium]
MEQRAQEEQMLLFALAEREDVLSKKAKIYSRLLTDPALAKSAEEVGLHHEKRKDELVALALGKTSKKKNGQGRVEMNEENGEK